MLLTGAWYAPHADELVAQARVSSGRAARRATRPASPFDSLTYYPQAVVMFFPLPLRALLIAAAVVWVAAWIRRRTIAPSPGGVLLASWLAVPLVAFTAIDNKDPRYIAAAAPALAIVAARVVGRMRSARGRGIVLAATGAYTLAIQLVLWRAAEPRALVEHALGAAPRLSSLVSLDVQAFVVPDPEGWPARDVAEQIRAGLTPVAPEASLAVVPDLAYVNAATLRWAARRAGFELRTFHPDRVPTEPEVLGLGVRARETEGGRGPAVRHAGSASITADVMARRDSFHAGRSFGSPDGPLLLVRTRHSVPPADLRPPGGRIDLQDASHALAPGGRLERPRGLGTMGDGRPRGPARGAAGARRSASPSPSALRSRWRARRW